MPVDYTNTEEDYKEAFAARIAVLTKKPGTALASPAAARRRRRTSLTGWILFAVLAGLLAFVLHNQKPGPVRPSVVPPLHVENNIRLVIDGICSGPFFAVTVIAWIMSYVGRTGSVPFFTSKAAAPRWPRAVWRMIAFAGFIAWAATAIDFATQTKSGILVAISPWVICFGIVGVASRFLRVSGSRWLQHAESSLREPRRLEVTDSGLALTCVTIRYELSWAYFVSYLESQNLLILYTRDLTMYVVPKRAFPDEAAIFDFCGVLQSHIPAGQFLARTSGFPVLLK